MTAEKKNFEVGEKAKIIIKSPYMKAKALITMERGGIFKYDIVSIDKKVLAYDNPTSIVRTTRAVYFFSSRVAP